MKKIVLFNLAPLAVAVAAIFLLVAPNERFVLIAAALGISLLWAGVVYSVEFLEFLALVVRRSFARKGGPGDGPGSPI